MEYRIEKLSDILNKIEKNNSGIILGNGFCNWLYQGREEKVWKRYKNWNLSEIIKCASDLFIEKTNKDINNIIEEHGNNVDKIFCEISKIMNQELANKWLIFFLQEILTRVNHTGIKKSENLTKLYKVLKKINFKFTTNYDPSFYWTIMKIKNLWPTRSSWEINLLPRGGKNPEFDDGFFKEEKKLYFLEDYKENCKVFYLHGAIFFKKPFSQLLAIEKIYSKNTNKDIIKMCNEYLESCLSIIDNKLPLLAVIGTNKNHDIKGNAYLSFALNRLIRCDDIITFGLSFAEDYHILDNIIKYCNKNTNKMKNLYIGCYDLETDNITNPMWNFKIYFESNIKPNNLNIIFYNSNEIDNLNI